MRARAYAACLIAFIAAVWCLVAPLQAAQASEEIRSFDVEIAALPDGTLEVTETIRYAIGKGLKKRGILRYVLLTTPSAQGDRTPVTFDVLSVRRNGKKEPYSIFWEDGYALVRVGDKDVFLTAPSEQVYELRYRSKHQIRKNEQFDELYWNVTGYDWPFPILSSSVKISLPGKYPISRHAAYTGPYGQEGKDFDVIQVEDGLYRARTTAELPPDSGFTVAIAWPKGLIAQETSGYFHGLSVGQVATLVATGVGSLALLLIWFAVGRDPRAGTIYPEFEPPKGIGPAAARYIREKGFDSRCMTAAIVSMAVKGAVRIISVPPEGTHGKKTYQLEPLGSSGKQLTLAERSAYKKLFPESKVLDLDGGRSSGRRMDKARSILKSSLKAEHYGVHFLRNTLHTVLGTSAGLASAAFLLFVIWQQQTGALAYFTLWFVAAMIAAVAVNVLTYFWVALGDGRWSSLWALTNRLWVYSSLSVFALLGLAVSGQRQHTPGGEIDYVALASGFVFGLAFALFQELMASPTKSGRRLLDRIEGFALYLGTAEEERLDLINPPERTPELFERLLPYAIALGLSHQWSARFANVLGTSALPSWYAGSNTLFSEYGDVSGFAVEGLDGGFDSFVASSSASAFSASGGGGFSGGGGGGGGGGSW